jgi:hypothetical protein
MYLQQERNPPASHGFQHFWLLQVSKEPLLCRLQGRSVLALAAREREVLRTRAG